MFWGQKNSRVLVVNFRQAKFSFKAFSEVKEVFAISKTLTAAYFVTEGKSSKNVSRSSEIKYRGGSTCLTFQNSPPAAFPALT